MHEKECDGSIVVGGCENIQYFKRREGCDKCTKESLDAWVVPEDGGKERPGGALNVQVGGNHYKDFPIQPVEFVTVNSLGQDLQKAKHEIDLLIELEEWI
jgi:hypothetical protein